ncbi:hypothetical protein [Anaerovorax sp. IOR16]|uniref:hypothetical protein n=1 Tax=Anaerovorax sp. IOR16 TaxID=2773458 RepID=UPI0019D2A4B3|nr:hypothetical protein [Anaerovorax sp. IOR16]
MTKKETAEKVIAVIDDCLEKSKINGKNMIADKAEQFAKVRDLALELFEDADIVSDIPTDNTQKSHFVQAFMEEFELNEITKPKFIELVNLADEVIVRGGGEDNLQISFYVNGIWEE